MAGAFGRLKRTPHFVTWSILVSHVLHLIAAHAKKIGGSNFGCSPVEDALRCNLPTLRLL